MEAYIEAINRYIPTTNTFKLSTILGIVFKQSSINSFIILIAFAIGGYNTMFLYVEFMTPQYYGLIVFLLSAANIIMPFTAFGVHHAMIKFYPAYKSKKDKDAFLSWALLIPLCIAIPTGVLGTAFYEKISELLSVKNEIIKSYTYIIYAVAVSTAYFEVFYAWTKVHLQSVFGNALKELFHRVATFILLVLTAFKIINVDQFINLLMLSYLLKTLFMFGYALIVYRPKFTFRLPANFKEILTYAGYIILAGSAGAILLEIDKVMLPSKQAIELTAYYTVGVFIASVIEVPGRAMSQILHPLTSKAIQENNMLEVASLYKRSAINLLLVSGLLFILVNANVKELYKIIPNNDFSQGIYIVLMVSFAKLTNMILGNNGAILSNSKFFKILLPLGIFMAIFVTFLNHWWIGVFGMNGAALSTLVVILVFNTLKVWYVHRKFSIIPFSLKTVQLVVVISLLFLVFNFWDFSFHPIVNIVLKSSLIVFLYLFVIYKLKVSDELQTLLSKYI